MTPSPPVAMKKCPRCPEPRPIEDFRLDRARKDGRYSYCREHTREMAKVYWQRWRKENLERRRIYALAHRDRKSQVARERRRRERAAVLEHYGGTPPSCGCCGEGRPEFLALDHINGGGRQERKRVGHATFWSWLIRQGFPTGYRVLCHNCNMSHGFFGYCPHEREREHEVA